MMIAMLAARVSAVYMTPLRMACVAADVAKALTGDVFEAEVALLRSILICPERSYGYDRPTTSRLQGVNERQGLPTMPTSPEDLLVSVRDHVMPHVEAAIALSEDMQHPLARHSESARPDLVAAVEWVAGFAGDAGALTDERDRRLTIVRGVKGRLGDIERRLQGMGSRSPRTSIALITAMSVAAGLPGALDFAACRVHGFPCVGHYRDTGWFRECPKTAEWDVCAQKHAVENARVVANLEAKAIKARGDPVTRRELEHVTRITRDETKGPNPTSSGPFTSVEVDGIYGAGEWRCLHGFGLFQGYRADGTEKWRRCDNARRSGTNAGVGADETIACEDATFPALVASIYYKVFGDWRRELRLGTDDVAMAYRTAACAHPEFTVVAIYDTDAEGVRFFTMTGHNFGLWTAVISWNWIAQVVAALARRFFGCNVAAYFDDFATVEPIFAGRTGKMVLHALGEMMGSPFSSVKDEPMRTINVFLGVVSDLSQFVPSAVVTLVPKPERVKVIVAALTAAVAANHFESWADVARWCGKVEYLASSTGYGRCGRAPLSAIRAWAKSRRGDRHKPSDSHEFTAAVAEAISFFIALLPLIPPRKFCFRRRARKPIIVYTDAMYTKGAAVPAAVGMCIYDPYAKDKWRHSSAEVPKWIMEKFKERDQYIGQLEVIAAVATYSSMPLEFRERDVIHFIDNTGALVGIAKGYSKDVDSARLINVFHTIAAAIMVNAWFEYVPSAANIADLPSRMDMELLTQLGSVPFKIVWPDPSEWHGGLEDLFERISRPRASRKRMRSL